MNDSYPLYRETTLTEEVSPGPDLVSESAEERDRREAARRQAVIQLLRSWREAEGDAAQEQRETWAFLQQALDEDRLSYRKLFPCHE
jgi:hypothetical protein